MKVYGYVRVSSDSQVETGVSLDAQKARIEAWCKAGGHELVRIETDAGKSGKRADNREALQRVLKAVTRDKATLCVFSLSRLARSTRDALEISEQLGKAQANLCSLSESIDTSTPMGKMFYTMISALCQMEREILVTRTCAALDYLRSQGRKISRFCPFGFVEEDGNWIPDPEEQATIKRMREMHASGWSTHAIADTLNAAGIPAKRSGLWRGAVIGRILARA